MNLIENKIGYEEYIYNLAREKRNQKCTNIIQLHENLFSLQNKREETNKQHAY
jgi:hypothetical protein